MLFKTVNHVAIICSNFEISKDFYVNRLGFKIITQINRPERQSTILYLDAGDIIIELFSFPNPPKRLSYPEAAGLRHIAFNVPNFDKTVQKLNSLNILTEPVRIDQRTGKRMTFFKDPDNLPVEIYEK